MKHIIIPVILYGLDCVSWTSSLCSKVEIFQNHMMRLMTNHKLTDHVKISDLRKKTKLPPTMNAIKRKVLKLFGDIKRSKVGYSKLCLEGRIESKRSRGRQHQRWYVNVKKWANLDTTNLNQATLDKNLWERIFHVSAQSVTGGESD